MFRLQRLTRHTSACFRSRAPGPVSGRLYRSGQLEDQPGCFRFPVAFPLPAFASWASCSRQGIGLPLQLAYRHAVQIWRTRTGFPRFARMRYGRVGCPLYSGDDGVHTAIEESVAAVCRLSAASLLFSPALLPAPGSCRNEASTRVHSIHPFGSSPHLWSLDGARILGLFPELRTRPLLATHVRAGTGPGH